MYIPYITENEIGGERILGCLLALVFENIILACRFEKCIYK